MKKITLAVVIGLASLNAHAKIVGLYSTGEGYSAGSQDLHYALSSSTTSVGSFGYVASNNVWPISPWVSNTATSAWLTPAANQGQSFDPTVNGTYTWTTTFDLTGYDASTASFTAQFAADNSALAYLNGNLVGTSNSFSSWSTFSADSSYFVSGVNVLSFVVTNRAQRSGNPTGLQVNILSSAVSAVPEATPYAMLLIGLGVLGFVVRRKL